MSARLESLFLYSDIVINIFEPPVYIQMTLPVIVIA